MMRIINFVLVILLTASSSAYAKSASDTAVDYFNVLKQKDYDTAATFFDPTSLGEFRKMMGFINEIPDENRQGFFNAFFGPGTTPESVSKLSDAEFFSSFLGAIMAQADAAGGVNFDGMKVLGEVMEGPDISHVVTRNKVSVGEIEVEVMEVVSFKKSGTDWKALMSGKMKGMAKQLRAAMSQLQ